MMSPEARILTINADIQRETLMRLIVALSEVPGVIDRAAAPDGLVSKPGADVISDTVAAAAHRDIRDLAIRLLREAQWPPRQPAG